MNSATRRSSGDIGTSLGYTLPPGQKEIAGLARGLNILYPKSLRPSPTYNVDLHHEVMSPDPYVVNQFRHSSSESYTNVLYNWD